MGSQSSGWPAWTRLAAACVMLKQLLHLGVVLGQEKGLTIGSSPGRPARPAIWRYLITGMGAIPLPYSYLL